MAYTIEENKLKAWQLSSKILLEKYSKGIEATFIGMAVGGIIAIGTGGIGIVAITCCIISGLFLPKLKILDKKIFRNTPRKITALGGMIAGSILGGPINALIGAVAAPVSAIGIGALGKKIYEKYQKFKWKNARMSLKQQVENRSKIRREQLKNDKISEKQIAKS